MTLETPASDAVEPGIPVGPRAPNRSAQIVVAAYELLEEEGLEGLTIRAVLARTGLARRAFYERFAGKDDLVLAVFEETIRIAANHFAEQVRGLADPMQRLELIVTSIVLGAARPDETQTGRRGAALSREHLRLAESRPRDLEAALRPLIALFADQLAAGMAAGQVRLYDPNRLAALVYNMFSTTVQAELVAEEGGPANPRRRTELATEIWDFCRRAIAA